MTDVVIIDGVRTPIGKFGGGLSKVRPDDLLAHTYKALMDRTGVDPALIEDVYAGCGNQAGEDNRDVARMSALLAGFPDDVPGVTVNRNCASALEAVNQAAKSIVAVEGDVYIGTGVESMSRAPWSVPKPEGVPTTQPPKMWDTTVGLALPQPQDGRDVSDRQPWRDGRAGGGGNADQPRGSGRFRPGEPPPGH